MSRWKAVVSNLVPAPIADSTQMTANKYLALQGGAANQHVRLRSMYIGGLATADSICENVVAYDSTVATGTLSGVTVTPNHPYATALSSPPKAFTTATTNHPSRSTSYLMAPGFNAYGGIVRWFPDPNGEPPTIIGATASMGEISLSTKGSGGVGPYSAEFEYEPL